MRREDDIGFRLKRLNTVLRQKANNALMQYDLTFTQLKVLFYLNDHHEHPVRLKELEKYFMVSQPTMAGIIKRLEEKDFICAQTDPNDKRNKIVSLTRKGEEIHHHCAAGADKLEQRMHNALGEENIRELVRLLDMLYERVAEE